MIFKGIEALIGLDAPVPIMFVAVAGKVPSAFESCTEKFESVKIPEAVKFTLKRVASELQKGPNVDIAVSMLGEFPVPVPETEINLSAAPAVESVMFPVASPTAVGEKRTCKVPPVVVNVAVDPHTVPFELT